MLVLNRCKERVKPLQKKGRQTSRVKKTLKYGGKAIEKEAVGKAEKSKHKTRKKKARPCFEAWGSFARR